jgi:hypothetical protein
MIQLILYRDSRMANGNGTGMLRLLISGVDRHTDHGTDVLKDD